MLIITFWVLARIVIHWLSFVKISVVELTNWHQYFMRLPSYYWWEIWSQNCQSGCGTTSSRTVVPQWTLMMLWRNLSSLRGQTHKKLTGINKGKRRRKLAVNVKKDKRIFFQNDTNFVNRFTCFLIGYLKMSIKSHWLKSRQFDSWKLILN